MYCEQCQSEFPEAGKFCPQCGARLKMLAPTSADETTCPSCGKTNQPDRKFCIYCGSRISEELRRCPSCSAPAPAEAAFCGECGTAISSPSLVDPATPSRTKTSVTYLDQSLESDSFEAGDQSAREKGTFLDWLRNAREEGTFLEWLRKPALQISITIVLLLLVSVVSYRLGSHQQPKVEDEPISSPPGPLSPEVPTQSVAEDETKLATAAISEQEDGKVASPESNVAKASSQLANAPSVTEQPLTPPRLYRVTIPTALRDKPTWTGKEVVQLKAGIKITVTAIAGDWLKVESKANPPKPPGYVWKEDATPQR